MRERTGKVERGKEEAGVVKMQHSCMKLSLKIRKVILWKCYIIVKSVFECYCHCIKGSVVQREAKMP